MTIHPFSKTNNISAKFLDLAEKERSKGERIVRFDKHVTCIFIRKNVAKEIDF